LFHILNGYYNMMWRGSFLDLAVCCSISLLYLDDHWNFLFSINISMPLACTSSMLIICRFGVLMMSQKPCIFCLCFLIFLYYCLNVLTHFTCLQTLMFCLDLVHWWDFQLCFFWLSWAFHFQNFS
jgi:hypothetical protein